MCPTDKTLKSFLFGAFSQIYPKIPYRHQRKEKSRKQKSRLVKTKIQKAKTSKKSSTPHLTQKL